MDIAFHGVRGSYPVPGKETNNYGGNTSCVSVSRELDGKIVRIIIDCGTGAIPLGKEIVNNYFSGREDLDIVMLFTHLHPDHTQAFPFFAPNYFPDCNIHLMGMRTLKKHIGNVLEQEMLPPTFPIEYKDLKSKRKHYELKDGQTFFIEKDNSISNKYKNSLFKVDVLQSFAPSHPQQGALYYKISELGDTEDDVLSSVACIWDIESHPGGDQRVIKFAKDADLMIHDTQYTSEEYDSGDIIVQGFGHSTHEMAIENFEKSNCGQLVFFHYNPAHSDKMLESIKSKFCSRENIIMSHEGLTINL
jgi:phosphoribosyl 1,2-cyclic phosphodiesterase